jgi:Antibiotic biosynthesis monooxygenase
MAVVRMHRYQVDPADLEELLARRATLISAIRAAHPGLAEARLTRLEDGTYTDVWRWDSSEQMLAAFGDMAAFPEAGAAMALTQGATAVNGEIIDER